MYKRLLKSLNRILQTIANSRISLRKIEILDRRSENRMTEFGMLAQAF